MQEFWQYLDRLIEDSAITIDRPKGTAHPRFPSMVYPVDYGYLEGTTTVDGGGIDVWHGTATPACLTAIVCTVDLLKRDTEIKLLLGCTPDEIETIVRFHNGHIMRAMLVPRSEDVTS